MHLHFVSISRENRRAALGAEMPPFIGPGLTSDLNGILRENGSGEKQSAMMFSAIQAVADPYPVGIADRYKPNIAAEAASSDFPHIPLQADCPSNPAQSRLLHVSPSGTRRDHCVH